MSTLNPPCQGAGEFLILMAGVVSALGRSPESTICTNCSWVMPWACRPSSARSGTRSASSSTRCRCPHRPGERAQRQTRRARGDVPRALRASVPGRPWPRLCRRREPRCAVPMDLAGFVTSYSSRRSFFGAIAAGGCSPPWKAERPVGGDSPGASLRQRALPSRHRAFASTRCGSALSFGAASCHPRSRVT